jgi:hypothetical protein
MEKWKVGDIAICIQSGRIPGNSASGNLPPLRLNAEYVVQNIRACECQNISLDVGLGLDIISPGVVCSCGSRSSAKTGIWWCNASRFTKKKTKEETKEEIEEAINEAIKSENYELASELTQKL